ncbi:MAG: hypothetical protein ABIE42_00855 [Candidatus Eisenbacteria bacterium]
MTGVPITGAEKLPGDEEAKAALPVWNSRFKSESHSLFLEAGGFA